MKRIMFLISRFVVMAKQIDQLKFIMAFSVVCIFIASCKKNIKYADFSFTIDEIGIQNIQSLNLILGKYSTSNGSVSFDTFHQKEGTVTILVNWTNFKSAGTHENWKSDLAALIKNEIIDHRIPR